MRVQGVVREWDDGEGWGVIDSEATPGGCWAHYSSVNVPGYKSLTVGASVTFVVTSGQDGFAYRAEDITPT